MDKANARNLVDDAKRKVFGSVRKALDEQASTLSDLEIDMVLGALLSCTIASVSLCLTKRRVPTLLVCPERG